MTKKEDFMPILKNRLYYLFKRGKKEHIEALFEEGEIYINSIDFIRECDDNKERSDRSDGIMTRSFLGDGEIKMCDVGKDPDKDGITMNARGLTMMNDHEQKGNIYCLTGIYSEDLLGERNDITFQTKSFGEAIIFIHSPKKFIDRLFKALKKEGFTNYKADKVFYYKNDYSGKVGFFKKHERFKAQCEYRIFIPNKKDEPIKLKIGSLKDIASINTGFINLTYTDNKEQLIIL